MSSAKKKPEKDPYEVLGVPFGSSEAVITKAYRQLARQLHPDKLGSQNLSESELAKATARFHDIQVSRSFLLDAEHAEDKRKYDAAQASDKLRRETERAREKGMSERRKRMREELKQQEQQADVSRNKKKSRRYHETAPAESAKDNLARQGREMREEYAARTTAAQELDRKKAARNLEERQVRLKWSRKKLKAAGESSPSEDSIAKQLSAFGVVKAVLMIGDKGNLALVTFEVASSCDKAVDAYADSNIWRATYVSKQKKQRQQAAKAEQELADVATTPTTATNRQQQRDGESVNDWKLRQAAEREQLLRQMEAAENNHNDQGGGDNDDAPAQQHRHTTRAQTDKPRRPFPPPFPSTDDFEAVQSPLEKLQLAESLILKDIVSPDALRRMKVTATTPTTNPTQQQNSTRPS